MSSSRAESSAHEQDGQEPEFTAQITPEHISRLKAECSTDETPSGAVSLSPLVAPIAHGNEAFTMVCDLGVGSTGTVFLAIDHRATGRERFVAVKRFLPELTERELFTDLFIEELQGAVCVSHPNACKVTDFGRTGPSYYLAMEFLHGESLATLQMAPGFRQLQARKPRMIASLFARFAEGLHAAHTRKDEMGDAATLHRDVTPRNLFVLYDGTVRVTDFGTAWTRDMGKDRPELDASADLSCWAPEQLDHVDLDARVDIWGLGVVLWETLTGQKLFQCNSEREAAVQITARRVPPPSELNPQVPPELDRIVLRALTRNRYKRQATALELAAELHAYVTSSGSAVIDEAAISAWIAQLMPDGAKRGRNLLELAEAVDERETGADVADADAHYMPAGQQDDVENTTHIFAGALTSNTLRSMERLPFDPAPMEAVSFKDAAPSTARKPRAPVAAARQSGWRSGILPFATPIVIALLGILVWQGMPKRASSVVNDKPVAASVAPEAAPVVQTASALPAVAPTATLPPMPIVRDERPPKPREVPVRTTAPSASIATRSGAGKDTSTPQMPGVVFVSTAGEVSEQGRVLGKAPGQFELSPGPHTLQIKTPIDVRTATVNVPTGAMIMVGAPPPTPAAAATTPP